MGIKLFKKSFVLQLLIKNNRVNVENQNTILLIEKI